VKVAFHSGYLGFRGTEVALVDYAKGNREILGGESLFLLPWRNEADSHPVVHRMRAVAPVHWYLTEKEREDVLKREKADFFYSIKNGFFDRVVSDSVPTGIHAIFRESEFHGDIYAYVSPWLSQVMSHGKTPWVPHMVSLGDPAGDLRDELGIPSSAVVFGRHGGDDSFDLPWVQKTVVKTAQANPLIHFIFLNTRVFVGGCGLKNIHFLPATPDPKRKRSFLESCDAMIHGRRRGETFGLSCMEFAVAGKKVLTFSGSPERAHLELLGEAAIQYDSAETLASRLLSARDDYRLPPAAARELANKFGPEQVMKQFRQVFLS
jgi:hypothetical protein